MQSLRCSPPIPERDTGSGEGSIMNEVRRVLCAEKLEKFRSRAANYAAALDRAAEAGRKVQGMRDRVIRAIPGTDLKVCLAYGINPKPGRIFLVYRNDGTLLRGLHQFTPASVDVLYNNMAILSPLSEEYAKKYGFEAEFAAEKKHANIANL